MVSDVIDVAIGLIFIYLLLSMICSTLNEFIARFLAYRAQTLEQGILTMLKNPATVQALYKHPLVDTQYRPSWFDRLRSSRHQSKPSYIAAGTFSLTLIDILETRPEAQGAIKASDGSAAGSLAAAIDANSDQHLHEVLRLLTAGATGDYEKMKASIELWYDDTMDRVSGWYKRKVQLILFIISLTLSVGLGIDTITLGTSLWQNSSLRAVVVAAAQQQVRSVGQSGRSPIQTKTLQDDLNQINVPLGYSSKRGDPRYINPDPAGWLLKALGLLLTTIALSLGAPFWFDLLNNVVNLRQSGPKPNSTT